MKKIDGDVILFREENVNGCGDFADVFVHVDRTIEQKDIEALSVKLAFCEKLMRDGEEYFDTDQMVEEACDEVFGEGHWDEVGYHLLPF